MLLSICFFRRETKCEWSLLYWPYARVPGSVSYSHWCHALCTPTFNLPFVTFQVLWPDPFFFVSFFFSSFVFHCFCHFSAMSPSTRNTDDAMNDALLEKLRCCLPKIQENSDTMRNVVAKIHARITSSGKVTEQFLSENNISRSINYEGITGARRWRRRLPNSAIFEKLRRALSTIWLGTTNETDT